MHTRNVEEFARSFARSRAELSLEYGVDAP